MPHREAPKTILIVEDDSTTRLAMKLTLEDRGYAVTGVTNGREALRHLHRGEVPDLIVLDLMMPEMTGWQFREQQQHDPNLRTIPVVLISSDANLPQKAADMGVFDYLSKPVDFERLLDTVDRIC